MAPNKDGDIVMVKPGFLGNGEHKLIKLKEPAELGAIEQPFVNGLTNTIRSDTDLVYEWTRANELKKVRH